MKIHAAHILVKTEGQARQIRFDLKDGKAFEALAKEKSLCPSGKKGGDLGWFAPHQMVKPFSDACKDLDSGAVSQPVKTKFGWHVIKVIDKK